MKKGTLTPNGIGGFDLEIHNVSGDWKSNAINTAMTLGLAMITGAATYAGQVIASMATQKAIEASQKKKQKEAEQ